MYHMTKLNSHTSFSIKPLPSDALNSKFWEPRIEAQEDHWMFVLKVWSGKIWRWDFFFFFWVTAIRNPNSGILSYFGKTLKWKSWKWNSNCTMTNVDLKETKASAQEPRRHLKHLSQENFCSDNRTMEHFCSSPTSPPKQVVLVRLTTMNKIWPFHSSAF